MPLPKFLASIFGGGASEMIDSVDKLVDNLTFSKEEKESLKVALSENINLHLEKMAGLTQTELESYLKDVSDARQTNVQIQTSDKASWLAKNVAYCIDVFIILVWGVLTTYLMCVMLNILPKDTKVDYTAVTAVWGGVTAFAGTIMNFHRGSSKSSEEKSKQLNELMNK